MYALDLRYRELWTLLVLALLTSGYLLTPGTVVGTSVIEGVIAGGIGLAICSGPARSAIDACFVGRFVLARLLSGWHGRAWIALNGLVLLAGWLVLALALTGLVGA